MNPTPRRLAGSVVLGMLVTLVVLDLSVGGVRLWWDRHSLTGSIVSSLLVLGVTALVVDELVARRQRNERALSVAVQGLIVYGQVRRTYDGVMALSGAPAPGVQGEGDESHSAAAGDDLRTLANMLLTAASAFYDDPLARRFLEQVERLAASLVRALASAGGTLDHAHRARLEGDMTELKAIAEPLLARIPERDWPRADRPVQA